MCSMMRPLMGLIHLCPLGTTYYSPMHNQNHLLLCHIPQLWSCYNSPIWLWPRRGQYWRHLTTHLCLLSMVDRGGVDGAPALEHWIQHHFHHRYVEKLKNDPVPSRHGTTTLIQWSAQGNIPSSPQETDSLPFPDLGDLQAGTWQVF